MTSMANFCLAAAISFEVGECLDGGDVGGLEVGLDHAAALGLRWAGVSMSASICLVMAGVAEPP